MELNSIQKLSQNKKYNKLMEIILRNERNLIIPFEELAELKQGWFNGKGQAFQENELKWFGEKFYNSYDPKLPLPRLYPTPNCTIQAEWSTEIYEVSLEINLNEKTSEYQSVNVITTDSDDITLNLQDDNDWKILNSKLKVIYGIINE